MFKASLKKFFNLLSKLSKKDCLWKGDFEEWTIALKSCSGYDEAQIFEAVKRAALIVKDNRAAYERDSILFYEKMYSFPLLTTLFQQYILNSGYVNLIDFGGSLGSKYYQNRDALKKIEKIKWCIIEQEKFVTAGNKIFQDNILTFYDTIEQCILAIKPNNFILMFSCVLQYLQNPKETIIKCVSFNPSIIIIERTAFIKSKDARLTIQKVPKKIYSASYPAWFFNEKIFLSHFKGYYIDTEYISSITKPTKLEDGSYVYWKTFILKKI